MTRVGLEGRSQLNIKVDCICNVQMRIGLLVGTIGKSIRTHHSPFNDFGQGR